MNDDLRYFEKGFMEENDEGQVKTLDRNYAWGG
jgi:hypothetical protein